MKGTIIGNLGRDAEIKTSDAGSNRLVFSVADTVGWGENQKTQWVNCTLFGKRADSLIKYMLKGTKVVIFGEVSVREYEDKNGCNRWSLDCVVSDVVLAGKPKSDSAPAAAAPKKESSVDEDDIPF